jgi:hypothetical protein
MTLKGITKEELVGGVLMSIPVKSKIVVGVKLKFGVKRILFSNQVFKPTTKLGAISKLNRVSFPLKFFLSFVYAVFC